MLLPRIYSETGPVRARRQAKEKGLCLHTRDKGLKRRSAVPLCLPGCLSGPLCSRAKAARTRRDGRITAAGRHSLLRARTRGRFSLLLGGDVSGGPRRCLAPPGSSLARSFRRTWTSSTLYYDKLMMCSHIIRLPRKKSTPFSLFFENFSVFLAPHAFIPCGSSPQRAPARPARPLRTVRTT